MWYAGKMEKKWPSRKEIEAELDARAKRDHELTQKSRQQAEAIVTEIAHGCEYRDEKQHRFTGKIGAGIRFNGVWDDDHHYVINLAAGVKKLGQVETEGGLVEANGEIADTTAITLISPGRKKGRALYIGWAKLDGVDIGKKVIIDYADKEKPEDVGDNIYRAVMQSKQKAAAKKLSKLNIATGKTQDSGREM